METFFALLAICAGNSPVPGEFPTQRPVTQSFDVYFDLRPNKRLSKPSWSWWFETLSPPLWRHRNVLGRIPPRIHTKWRVTAWQWTPQHQPVFHEVKTHLVVHFKFKNRGSAKALICGFFSNICQVFTQLSYKNGLLRLHGMCVRPIGCIC